MLILLLVSVTLTALILALGTLPEPTHSHHCRTPYEDAEQAALVSGRPVPMDDLLRAYGADL